MNNLLDEEINASESQFTQCLLTRNFGHMHSIKTPGMNFQRGNIELNLFIPIFDITTKFVTTTI